MAKKADHSTKVRVWDKVPGGLPDGSTLTIVIREFLSSIYYIYVYKLDSHTRLTPKALIFTGGRSWPGPARPRAEREARDTRTGLEPYDKRTATSLPKVSAIRSVVSIIIRPTCNVQTDTQTDTALPR